MFTPEQIKELNAPLVRSHVKKNPRGYDYVEGWHAIAEANRIFGFDGWTRETIELRCVAERERKIGRDQKPGWGVSYVAKVRVTVHGVVREGYGAGHGIDVDLGLAHESAIKEAETDAMKRALMTFGNPFGLALYDKEQANVCNEPPAAAPPPPFTPEESATVRDTMIFALEKCESHAEIFEWREQQIANFPRLTRSDKLVVAKARELKESDLNQPEQQAAE